MAGAVSLAWPGVLNPSTWFNDAVEWLAQQALTGVNSLWALLERTALFTPDVTRLSQVRELNATSLVIVNAVYVLAVLLAAILVMTRDSLQVRYGIGELAPRLILGLIAANMAPLVVTQLIGFSNALTTALTGEGLSSAGAFARLQRTVAVSVKNPTDLLLALILCLIIAGLTAALMVTWLVRIGVLVVLAGIAPLALACHGLPQSDPVAKLWWRSVCGCLATVVLQALMLHTTLAIFLGDGVTRRELGLDSADSSSLNLFIVMCLLWTTVKIPGLMRRYVTRGGGGTPGAAILRVVLVQQLTRGLSQAMSRSSSALRRGGGSGGRTGGAARRPSGGGAAGASRSRPQPDAARETPARPAPSAPGPRAEVRPRPSRPWPNQHPPSSYRPRPV